MKKYTKSIILIILLQVVTWSGMCQDLNDKKTHSNSFVNKSYLDVIKSIDRTPVTSALYKEAGLKPDLLTGALGVKIPLYSIKSGKIGIPLSLNYNSDSDDDESICGMLGEDWNLSTDYAISRKVMGYPDDFNNVNAYIDATNIFDIVPLKGIFYKSDNYYEVRNNLFFSPEVLADNLDQYEKMDMEYDEFYYSIPGKESGCFCLSDKGIATIVKGEHVDVEVFPKSNPKLITSFIVTTKDGMRYYFGTDDSAVQYSKQTNLRNEYKRENKSISGNVEFIGISATNSYYEPKYTFCNNYGDVPWDEVFGMVGYYSCCHANKFDTSIKNYRTVIPSHKTKWGITKVEDIDGNSIHFNYKANKQNVSYYTSSNISAQGIGIMDFSFKHETNGEHDLLYSVFAKPTLTFSVTQTKHEDDIPCLESIDADPFIVSFNSTQTRKDLIGANKLNSIEISKKVGVNLERLKKYDFKYEEKLAVDDTSFSYDLFHRESQFGASEEKDIGNPFYHSETISQEKNRLFLRSITEIGKDDSKLPAFEFSYNNSQIGKKNPYPVYKDSKAPIDIYDNDDVVIDNISGRGLDRIFGVNRTGPQVFNGRKKYAIGNSFFWPKNEQLDYKYYEYRMPFLKMKEYVSKDLDNGNLVSVIYPTGLKKEIQWADDAVDNIITKDNTTEKFIQKEKFEYQWETVENKQTNKYLLGTNNVKHVKLAIDYENFDEMSVDENIHFDQEYKGYLRTWSAKVFDKEFGSSSRASKETTVKLLGDNDQSVKGKTVYSYNIIHNNRSFDRQYVGDAFVSNAGGSVTDKLINGIPLRFTNRVNIKHGLLNSIVTYDKEKPIKKVSYEYDQFKSGKKRLDSYMLSTDLSSYYELENYAKKKEYKFFNSRYQDYSDEFNYKLSEKTEEFYYSGSIENKLTKQLDYGYDDYYGNIECFDLPRRLTTILNDGSKLIQEYQYVGDFKDLTSYYNSSACLECDQLRRDCYDECNTGPGGLRPPLSQEESADPNYEPDMGNNECLDYCLEEYERCKEKCGLEGLTPFSAAVRDLYRKKCYALPLETLVWKEKDGLKTLMSAELIEYNTNGSGQSRPYVFNKFPNPGNVTSFAPLHLMNSNLSFDSRYEMVGMIDRYDSHGNVEEFHTKHGKSTTTIWGYGGLYPVLRVENAKYNTVYAAFGYSSLSALRTSTTPLSYLSNFTNLRNHSYMANSLANFNSYNLSGGLECQYDANGKKTSYEYDEFNRLVCQKDNDGKIQNSYQYHYGSDAVKLNVSQSSLHFGAATETRNVDVLSNVSWLVSNKPNWIRINKISGTHNEVLSVTCETTNLTSSRGGLIILKGGGLIRTCRIYQKGKISGSSSILDVSASDLRLRSNQGSVSVSVNSNVSWQVTQKDYWFDISPSSGINNGRLIITYDLNVKPSIRSGSFTIEGGGIKKIINVVQEAGDFGHPQ